MSDRTAPKKRSVVRILVGGLSFLVLIIVVGILFLPKRPSFSRLKKGKTFNWVLITVDTLRADRIHCYGFPRIETPTMDLFAANGIKFERCIAQTPLTLPSHTSIMTGTHPTFHGIRDNGGFVVPEELLTLAELFTQNGYRTSAFVAAYVLDSKWGLDQGFDLYFDNFDLSRFQKISLSSVQRPADEVMDEALSWLEENSKRKFFTWIHLYDPHTPYEPPSPFDERYPNRPYIGEIAFTDSQLARLWAFLEEKDLLKQTFLVFASDHGESLGEHQESTHGFFIYQEAIHVPLIFVTPFEEIQGVVYPGIVSLVDILPTVCEMAGLSLPPQTQGSSLVPLFFGKGKPTKRFAYSETYYPRFHFGWSELKGVQDERFKLILAPQIELYDLIEDPEETKNLAESHPSETRRLVALAEKFIQESGKNAMAQSFHQVDEETRQRLAALGYIGSFIDDRNLEGKKLANPREKIHVFNELSRAREIGLQGQPEEAIRIIKRIIAQDPDIVDAYFTLGNIYFKNGEYQEAIANFEEALRRKPDETFSVINIANAYRRMGKPEAAEKRIIDHLEKGFEDSQLYFLLGGIKVIQQKDKEAIRYYEKCLEIHPSSSAAHNNLAALFLKKEDLAEAEKHIDAVLKINPKLTNAHYHLAQLLEEKGEIRAAAEAYRKELELSPRHLKACFNLSRLYRILGQVDEEEKYLLKSMDIEPEFPLSYFYLARIYLNRGEKYEEAIALVKKGITLKPDEKDLPLGYFLLADLYNRLGDNARSLEYAEKGNALLQK